MMRKTLLMMMLAVTMIAAAETHNLTVGLNAGAATYTTDAEASNRFGPSLGLQVNYTCLWSLGNYSPLSMGVATGLGLGWTQTGLSMDWHTQYVNVDFAGHQLQYTMQGTATQKDRQVQAELPLLLAFKAAGFRLNVGPKVMYVFPRTYSLSLGEANSDLDFLDFGVHMSDDPIAGQLPADRMTQSGSTLTPALNLLLTAQVGYEFFINEQHAIGLQAYIDYGLWNSYSNQNPTNRFIDVAPITDPNTTTPQITIYDLNASFVTKVNYLSFGLRFYWNMSWEFNRMRGGHHAPRGGRVYYQ